MRRLLVPLLALALVTSACSAFGAAPAATVDGKEISAKSIDDEIKSIRTNGQYTTFLEQSYGAPTLGSQGKGTFDAAFVAQVLSLRIWYSKIERDLRSRGKLPISRAVRRDAEQTIRDQFQSLDAKAFSKFPKAYRDQLVHQRALITLADDAISGTIGTDPREFYAKNREEFAVICLSHILVGTQNGRSAAQAQSRARKLYRSIASGEESFVDVARNESDDPGSAKQEGSLGCGSRLLLQFDPVFEAAAFAQKVGVLSKPVQTQFGSHLILVTKRTIPAFADVEAQINEVMRDTHDTRAQEYLKRVICAGDVHVNPRYGTWSTKACAQPGPALPSIEPPKGPRGTTTTTSAPLGG